MGVDHSAVLYVGKLLEGYSEVISFIEEYYNFTEEELEEIEVDGIGEFLYSTKHKELSKIECSRLNYYVSREESYYVLGTSILRATREPEKFAEAVKNAKDTWNSAFPNSECEVISEVKVY